MQSVLTVDVEDWYQTNDFNFPQHTWGDFEDRVEYNTRHLLDLFDGYGAKGTFFVLGCIAERYPSLVREIANRGHEVGSHGGWHRMLTDMKPAEVEVDLRFAKEILEDCIGQPVTCFRAPSWSVTRRNVYVLNLLAELGFTVDSSLQPFRTPLSGFSGIPLHPFIPELDGVALPLVEFPPTVGQFAGFRIPFSGGLYLRVMPSWLIRRLLDQVNQSRPGMIYLHPWEFDVEQPRLQVSLLHRFTHYYHLRSTEQKVHGLLSEFEFTTLRGAVGGGSFPKVAIATD